MTSPAHRQPAVISRSTILILSSFLIGMAVGNVPGSDLAPYVLVCGLSGFLVYIGLEMSSMRREMSAFQDLQRMIEDRLDRHVLSESSGGFVLPKAIRRDIPASTDAAAL